MCTAPMKRIQLSWSLKRPMSRGLAANSRITARATSVPTEIASAIHACGDSTSEGSSAKPMKQSAGSAMKPVRRSMASEANAVSFESMRAPSQLMRSTSPPMVDGSTLPTN